MEIYSTAILSGAEEARSSYLERRCWCWMALSRLYGGKNEGVAPVRQYIAYVLCKTDAVWGKTCTTAVQRRTRCRFLRSQMLFSDVPGFWIRFFCAWISGSKFSPPSPPSASLSPPITREPASSRWLHPEPKEPCVVRRGPHRTSALTAPNWNSSTY